MPLDAMLALAPVTTATASGSHAALDLKTNPSTPRRGLKATVQYSAAANASGSNNVFFQIDHSPDGINWYPLALQIENPAGAGTQGLALTAVAQAGELHLSFEGASRYVRLTRTIQGAGVSPTITYSANVSPGRP